MASKSRFVVGSHVWVEDPDEAWMDGLVEEINENDLVVNCTSGKKVTINVGSAYPKDTESPRGGVEDMTRLAYLHEPGVLQNLKSRYALNEIYTYTGNILIAVNPFQRLPHLYNNHMMGIYKGAEFGELGPHPFAIADRSYRLMINNRISQAILVSGESGAGKTESTKMLMQYLAFMGGKAQAEGRSVQQQILESNPVLEAFGNAKTVRNNNSSRFGKFVEIQFDDNGKISGAAIRTYLLERSRVCQISDPERNYHCFYMLCAAPSEDCKKYKLGEAKTFHYLNQSNCIELDGLDDSKEYTDTRRAMSIVGISSDEQFRGLPKISYFHPLLGHGLATFYRCDEKGLEESLCKRVMATRGESITKNLDPRAAALSRDALSRIVYSRLFDWLVNKINSSIGQDPDSKILIGVLDIYGFESFKTNSFEQFCINLTNEKLQQHFNQHVFKMEQEEYTKEEIDWSYIQFVDNQEILDLIEKKPGGIIALLDETCMLRNSTHETFAEKLYQKFKDNPHFSKPKFSRSDFTIHHYAGNVAVSGYLESWCLYGITRLCIVMHVTYQTDLFLDKNIDYAVNEHQILLNASKCSFVSSLFPPCEESTKSTKFSSIGSSFKQQLQSLLETLSAIEPHYIRCIKPNNVLKPAIFENSNVLQQLRCGGVLEAIRISCLGYPTRRTFFEFINRFGILQPKVLGRSHDEVAATKMLLGKANLTGYQIGKTKVFLRAGQMAELDALRTEILGLSAKKIQTKVRSHVARKKYVMLQHFATQLQASHCRCYLVLSNYKRMMKAIITTQCAWRGRVARRELRELKVAAKETGALQAAKSKLEKEVEELTWRLQLEKRIRYASIIICATYNIDYTCPFIADVEEAKAQENKKLQLQLQDLQMQLNDTKELLKREKESTKAEMEKTLVPEICVDTTQVNELTAENNRLKALVVSLETNIEEMKQKFGETDNVRDEWCKKATDAESQINELKSMMQSLQEKLNSTEAENHVLRQQAMRTRPDNMPLLNMHRKSVIPLTYTPSSSKCFILVVKCACHVHILMTPHGTSMEYGRTSYIERQQESVEALINCVVENVGFSEGKPVAAVTIYKCLLHWRTFEAEKTNVFDRLIQIFGSAMQKQESNADLAYWLSNSSSLLIILQKSLKPVGSSVTTPLKRTQTQTSFLGRMVFRASNITVDMDLVRQVEAKYPAFLFKQQLTAFVEGLYGMIRDNVKRDISSVLTLIIQTPRSAKAGLLTDQGNNWQAIVNHLNDLLKTLQENCVPSIFARKIFTQIFSFINAQLFNSLLVRRECCSFSNGEYVKQGLQELEAWCTQAKPESYLTETLTVIFKKFRISYDEIINDLCTALSVQQLYKICTQYWDDKYNTESVSEEVLNEMKTLMNGKDASDGTLKSLMNEKDASDGTFLLNEEISMPLSLEEIGDSMDAKEFQNVVPPQQLLDNPAFQFLKS
uniref:Myosin head family protein, expressed n=1 Tax=Oryza sativa subsp. japonica TaxID=39947 RepID=Q10A94_ORYSJ|nr:Myosin head family protein, expressed [Oryza sativa Japonica Group]